MKLRVAFAVALLLDALLLALVLLKPGRLEKTQETRTLAGAQMSKAAIIHTNAIAATEKLDWRSIESEDYRAYIKNLREIKCPEETIRDIIIADVHKVYSRRRAGIHFPVVTNSLLMPDFKLSRIYAEQLKQLHALEEERRQVLRELLGTDGSEQPKWQALPPERRLVRLAFLPEEKRTQVMAVMDKYSAEQDELYLKGGREGKRPDPKELQELRDRREAELAGLLSPAEYEQYQFRLHYRGDHNRTALYGFNPTEEEFRYLFNLSKPIDDKYEFYDLSNAAIRDQRQSELSALNDQIREHFGEKRYGEYDRVWSWEYKSLRTLAERFDFGPETLVSMYETGQALRQEQQRVMTDSSLGAEERQAQLAKIQRQARTAMTQLAGDKASEVYRSLGLGPQ